MGEKSPEFRSIVDIEKISYDTYKPIIFLETKTSENSINLLEKIGSLSHRACIEVYLYLLRNYS